MIAGMVEIRRDGRVVARMTPETWAATEPDELEVGDQVLVTDCPSCRCVHDLATMEEIVAVFGGVAARAARQFSDACVLAAARGHQ